jgi:6-phosphogluconate dehydrogenase (decarboxylating)
MHSRTRETRRLVALMQAEGPEAQQSQHQVVFLENFFDERAEMGYLHCGPNGAGHFIKMVHNGIEYGVMAAYAGTRCPA